MTTQADWHKADIIAALHKKDTSLAQISREANLASSTIANALTRPWAKGEIIIAQAIGVLPEEIWPSRYFDEAGKKIPRLLRNRA
jgi:Ner family transcriptional regulator